MFVQQWIFLLLSALMKHFQFLIKFGTWNATLLLHEKHTLNDLAQAILKAVKFELDHCYGFYAPEYFKRQRGVYKKVQCEEYSLFADMDSGNTDISDGDTGVVTTLIDDVFVSNKEMIFLFDYGDDWRFDVTCLKVSVGPAFKRAKILATEGIPPIQYRYDEEGH